MIKQVTVLGDMTNYGGRIITASGQGYCGMDGVALLGDLVSCPKCSSTGRIIEGANDFIIDGKPVAYDGCIVACKCTPVGGHRIIALNSTIFVGVSSGSVQSNSFAGNQKQFNSANNDENNLIRIDARRLLQCADELCEKHLYHDDIKQAFKQDVESFTNDIVEQVDSGAMTYEQGAKKIKAEEKSLWEQSWIWIKNGLSILGGAGLTLTGLSLCATQFGYIIGVPMVAHGLNDIYEGGLGIYNSIMNMIDDDDREIDVDGPLKKAYQFIAEKLGYHSSIGDTFYDLLDITGSVYGKLRFIPKLNEYGDPVFKLFRYGRQDFIRAYERMSKKMLTFEITSDLVSIMISSINFLNAFIYNQDTKQVIMIVRKPKTIINVKQIVDDCHLIITTAKTAEKKPVYYYFCKRKDGKEYRKNTDSNLIEVEKKL